MQKQAPHGVSSPSSSSWRFADLFDIDDIQRLQDAFALSHQVLAVMTDPDGVPITRPSFGRADDGTVPQPPSAAAVLDTNDGCWTDVADIGVGSVHLARWQVSREPGMARERFEQVCTFLAQAADLVSRQAVANSQLRSLLEAKERAEAERDQLEQRLYLTAGMEAVGRLAGGIAHDFGNLLTVITAYAEQLVQELPDPTDPDAPAVQILTASDRAIELVQRLLDVARHRQGARAPVDLAAVIGETSGLLQRTLPSSIQVSHSVHGDIPTIMGDGACLHSALLNLGINAGHAMPRGGRLTFTLRRRELAAAVAGLPPGRYLEICVVDTGQGMDVETQRQIFEPFFTSRETAGGTGLGLTRVYGCVTSHGGTIDVHSELGVGTVFTILLPV